MVEERGRIGDWEGDLIVGRASRSAIGTLVDRRTGYLRLVHLPDGHSAERLRVAMLPVLTDLPLQSQICAQRARQLPADHPPGVDVDDEGCVDPAGEGAAVR